MPNRLLSHRNLSQRTLNYVLHQLLSIQHHSRLVILLNKQLNLVQQFFVHLLVVRNQCQDLVNVVVQIFVSVQSIEVLFSQSLLLSDYEVQVVLLGSN